MGHFTPSLWATSEHHSHERVIGIEALALRTGETSQLPAHAVLLSTGGFQSNIAFLKEHWPAALRFPDRMLVGSGINSTGSGHLLAQAAGAKLEHLDRQWNYPWGLPDPRYAEGIRGVSVRIALSVWLNKKGERFVDEYGSPKLTTATLLRQPGATYWAIYDEAGKKSAVVAGTD